MRRALLALALLAGFPATADAAAACGGGGRVFAQGSWSYACGPAGTRPKLLWVGNAVSGEIRVSGRSGARGVPLTGESVTCTSGTTLIESEGARVFEVRRGSADVLAACARGASSPGELAVSQRPWTLRKWTGKAFLVGDAGVGVLEGGTVRFVAAPFGVEDVAIGESGPVVFAGDGKIAREESIFGWEWVAAAGGPVAKDSLAISGFDVTWRTQSGVAGSAFLRPVRPPDCGSGTTRVARRGLRVFDLVRAGGDQALLACPPGARVPLALLSAAGKARWSVRELGREHGRIGLLVHRRGAEAHDVISFDTRSVRAGLLYGLRGTIRDVALAPDGRVAIATRRRISALPLAGPGELGVNRTVAEPRDGIRPRSLRFDGTDVVWRNRAGKLRRAALR